MHYGSNGILFRVLAFGAFRGLVALADCRGHELGPPTSQARASVQGNCIFASSNRQQVLGMTEAVALAISAAFVSAWN